MVLEKLSIGTEKPATTHDCRLPSCMDFLNGQRLFMRFLRCLYGVLQTSKRSYTRIINMTRKRLVQPFYTI